MHKIMLSKEKAALTIKGHPWVFMGSLVDKIKIPQGELCEFYAGAEFVGIGYYDNRTNIAGRILSRHRETINEEFFVRCFARLREQKTAYTKDTNAYRLINGESDDLPGLIVDNYNGTLVAQFHTVGMEKLREYIIHALIKVFSPRALYEKNVKQYGEGVRREQNFSGVHYGEFSPEVQIVENGFKFLVNIQEGQKTGFFLDQRQNRKTVLDFTQDKKVLNCFSYTGGFSVYAASNAQFVDSVDISRGALDYAEKNFQINGFAGERHHFIKQDVFEYLKNIEQNQYDLIILDPPSLANNLKQVPQALKAYTTLNSKALEKLPSGGILVSSSCTAKIDDTAFLSMLSQSAQNASCRLKVLFSSVQPPDHAFSLSFPEGRYLKFYVLWKE